MKPHAQVRPTDDSPSPPLPWRRRPTPKTAPAAGLPVLSAARLFSQLLLILQHPLERSQVLINLPGMDVRTVDIPLDAFGIQEVVEDVRTDRLAH